MTDGIELFATAQRVIEYLCEHYYVPSDVALAALNAHRETLHDGIGRRASTAFVSDQIALGECWRMLPDPTVSGEGFWPWDSQAKQYPERDKPGIRYASRSVVIGVAHTPTGDTDLITNVETLLHYSMAGKLTGILCRYPDTIEAVLPSGDKHTLEEAGNISVWVKPSRRRRGIATALLDEAERRWSPDWFAMTFTRAGHALIRKHLRENPRRFHDGH